jgi:hypothetical protein
MHILRDNLAFPGQPVGVKGLNMSQTIHVITTGKLKYSHTEYKTS